MASGQSALDVAAKAVQEQPGVPYLLQLAGLAAVLADEPDQGLRYIKRLEKRWVAEPPDVLIKALALAKQRRWGPARGLLRQIGLRTPERAAGLLPCQNVRHARQVMDTVRTILDPSLRTPSHPGRSAPTRLKARSKTAERPMAASRTERPSRTVEAPRPSMSEPSTKGAAEHHGALEAPDESADERYPLSAATPTLSVRFKLPSATDVPGASGPQAAECFDIRRRLTEVALARGFDELLCLPTLQSVETYWYQVETVRKVLKRFRGRVLLADEVGLGKTIEACMIVKEYILRQMARRVLILTPPSLVGQWREELQSKFGLTFATTHDPRLKSDPEALWSEPFLVASIASARRASHAKILKQRSFDIVVVDEAHHLKNRSTKGYALVNALKKRFLVLLSATPVQNNLLELYNLLTLLKPGIFRTEKDFRAAYMTPGKPRVPANQSEMRDLMRDVMIRNTRALVDVRLPPRHATTLRPEPGPEEAEAYRDLVDEIRALVKDSTAGRRLSFRHLLTAAGSSPQAAAAALARVARKPGQPHRERFSVLADRYAAIDRGAKEKAFIDLVARNRSERIMVFGHHLATLDHLGALLRENGVAYARFDGSMSGAEKDAAVERFRNDVPILLSTEAGGEGRNVQFANTLVNFDLPWNPMRLEQRIGRIHRIGQTRDVFVFNLATRHTVEDHLLRILDDKINMFELVVGEIGDILGSLDGEHDFAEAVFSAWVETTDAAAEAGSFAKLEKAMLRAQKRHLDAKALDDELFGEDFEAA